MQNLPKKQWKPSLSIKDSADIMISWCIRAREKNILRNKSPQLYFAYIVEGVIPLQYLTNISQVFKYSQKDMPYIDQARDSLLRCLAIALKAHYFLFTNDKVAHEPYFFTFPNLSDPNQTIFGLIYKIEGENKTIIVCEKDLSLLLDKVFDKNKILYTFPAVLTDNSFKWYHIKNWSKIRENTLQNNNEKDIEKPWINKELLNKAKASESKEDLMKYATVLDVSYEIKDYIKPLGIEWSKKANAWYLPIGFDIESVNEYIEYVKKELAINKK